MERTPLPAVEIEVFPGIKMVVRQGVPTTEWGMVIAGAGQIEIIGVGVSGTDGRRRAAARERGSGNAAQQKQPDMFAPFHGRPARDGRGSNRTACHDKALITGLL